MRVIPSQPYFDNLLRVLLLLARGSLHACVWVSVSQAANPQSVQTARAARHLALRLAEGLHGSVARVANTGSMEPTLTGEDLVVFSQATESLHVGDVVVFRAPIRGYHTRAVLVCHRIVRIRADTQLVTRGDDNDTEDHSFVPPRAVLGVVRYAISLQTGELFTLPRVRGLRTHVDNVLLVSAQSQAPQFVTAQQALILSLLRTSSRMPRLLV